MEQSLRLRQVLMGLRPIAVLAALLPAQTITPDSLVLTWDPPGTTVIAGDSVALTARVYLDSVGADSVHHAISRPLYDNQVRWWATGLYPFGGWPPVLRGRAGPSATNILCDERSHLTTVIATYTDSAHGVARSDTAVFSIVPAGPHYVLITINHGVTPHPQGQIDTVKLPSTQSTNSVLYASLYDQFSNRIGPADPVTWVSRAPGTVTVSAGPDIADGQATVARQVPQGQAVIAAQQAGLLPDSVCVVLLPYSYTAVRVIDRFGTLADTLQLEVGGSSMLWAQGQRSDNDVWEYVPANWGAEGAVTARSGGPLSPAVTLSADSVGSGMVVARLDLGDGSAWYDTVEVSVVPRLSIAGAPRGSADARARIRMAGRDIAMPAGARSLVAHVFDLAGRQVAQREVPVGEALSSHDLFAGIGSACVVARVTFVDSRGRALSQAVLRTSVLLSDQR